MAHGRHHGRSTLVERTDPPLLRCRIVGTCRPVIDHRCPTRRRVGRFLRWIRRRYEPGADSLHHERFAYRQLRCHRVDFLLPSSMESFDVAPLSFACITLIAGDTISKLTSSQIINFLPYARKEEESKAKVVYNRMSGGECAFGLLCGILPSALLLPYRYWMAIVFPLVMLYLLCTLMKRKLQGYTGDCCGALFLLSELSFYLGIVILMFI